jgi:hypothetical protein
MEVGGQLHTPAALPRGRTPGTHWIRVWVGPRAGLDAVEYAERSLALTGNRPLLVQPAARRCTKKNS